jgi:hypothetical protein
VLKGYRTEGEVVSLPMMGRNNFEGGKKPREVNDVGRRWFDIYLMRATWGLEFRRPSGIAKPEAPCPLFPARTSRSFDTSQSVDLFRFGGVYTSYYGGFDSNEIY